MADNTDSSRVECGFDCTPITRVIMLAMAFIPLFVLINLFCFHVDMRSVGGMAAYLSCIAVMAAALVIKLMLGRGRITVDGEYVNVHYGFLSRKIPLGEITYFSCDVETQSGMYDDITYTMVLTIRTADKRYYYKRELDVEKDYPAKHPEEYRKYLDSQPMRMVYEYISKRV